MLSSTALLSSKSKFTTMYPVLCSAGFLGAVTPKSQEDDGSKEGAGQVKNEKTHPVAAFSKPPPFPPVLGPLIALSVLDSWSGRDSDDS